MLKYRANQVYHKKELTMIDEDATLRLYGYTTAMLNPLSSKKIVVKATRCKHIVKMSMRAYTKNGAPGVCSLCPRPISRVRMEEEERLDDRLAPYKDKLEREERAFREYKGLNSMYCPMFTEEVRERNRDKYGRLCFLCDKDEYDNKRRLSVHHVDMNKDQGCNEHDWSLVPLCASCHGKAHNPTWQSRIEYLLSSDKQ